MLVGFYDDTNTLKPLKNHKSICSDDINQTNYKYIICNRYVHEFMVSICLSNYTQSLKSFLSTAVTVAATYSPRVDQTSPIHTYICIKTQICAFILLASASAFTYTL